MYGAPWVIVAFVVYAVLKGKLVTPSAVADLRTERDNWKELALGLYSQNQQLMQVSELGVDLLKSLPTTRD